ncbi:hypothetical protein I3760_10G035800 [Carya illinoinensis]|nr:hypothetical protein I3760_10G035800 [Carya illinoinensis]
MTSRKRALADASATEHKSQDPTPTEPPTAPLNSKSGFILKLSLLLLSPYLYLIFHHYKIDRDLKKSILVNAGFSLAGFFVTRKMIPVASKYVLRRNLFGYDINKRGFFFFNPGGRCKFTLPESLGIVVGIVFLVLAILFQYSNFTSDSNWLVEYNAALASICFMTLLGFVDDVLDVPWRVKLLLPSFATLPLLMAYAGHTTIVIPKPLIPYLGPEVLDLGWIYKLYMGLLAVFCTNSINIHAGLNGLEVGQTVVIASAFNPYLRPHWLYFLTTDSDTFSCYRWNPSSVFVGDTCTYFAGMTMAVVGILGHFSETLLIFFASQVLNFLLSLPQLSGLVPCPRHRLPRFDSKTGQLTGTNDGTLVNFTLRLLGRMSEKSLCIVLLLFQASACCLCFVLRYYLAGWYK